MKQFTCEAVLFDLDGVLVDSTACIERHWKEWGQKHGLALEEILAIAHGRRGIDTIRLIAPSLSAEREAHLLEQIEVQDTEGVITLPGAASLLAALALERWAVVTSGSQALATARLQAAGLPGPNVLIGADDVAEGKPHPDGYLQAAQRLGVKPQHCLVIEDAPAGIAAARAAQIPVIAVATTHAPAQLQDADAWVSSLEVLRISPIPVSGAAKTTSLNVTITHEDCTGYLTHLFKN